MRKWFKLNLSSDLKDKTWQGAGLESGTHDRLRENKLIRENDEM